MGSSSSLCFDNRRPTGLDQRACAGRQCRRALPEQGRRADRRRRAANAVGRAEDAAKASSCCRSTPTARPSTSRDGAWRSDSAMRGCTDHGGNQRWPPSTSAVISSPTARSTACRSVHHRYRRYVHLASGRRGAAPRPRLPQRPQGGDGDCQRHRCALTGSSSTPCASAI